jgi:hypothetical protein
MSNHVLQQFHNSTDTLNKLFNTISNANPQTIFFLFLKIIKIISAFVYLHLQFTCIVITLRIQHSFFYFFLDVKFF